ncbi:hypothetical protein RIF29_14654 [Crotalaria pallida]|uniref:Uncharacterized protein n=1 Tax=Crotalaria pallida TaxID=3830 RepID=A0AAN9FI75_CROPI
MLTLQVPRLSLDVHLDHIVLDSKQLLERKVLFFMCGDVTLHKAPDLWRKWNSGMGQGLHSFQVLIAMRDGDDEECITDSFSIVP